MNDYYFEIFAKNMTTGKAEFHNSGIIKHNDARGALDEAKKCYCPPQNGIVFYSVRNFRKI